MPYKASYGFLLRRVEIYYKICKYELSFRLLAFHRLKTFKTQQEEELKMLRETHQYKC